jgi:hypothetical protein
MAPDAPDAPLQTAHAPRCRPSRCRQGAHDKEPTPLKTQEGPTVARAAAVQALGGPPARCATHQHSPLPRAPRSRPAVVPRVRPAAMASAACRDVGRRGHSLRRCWIAPFPPILPPGPSNRPATPPRTPPPTTRRADRELHRPPCVSGIGWEGGREGREGGSRAPLLLGAQGWGPKARGPRRGVGAPLTASSTGRTHAGACTAQPPGCPGCYC